MTSGFHQIPIKKKTELKKKKKTYLLLTTQGTQMKSLKMPFGLTNAPPVYQRGKFDLKLFLCSERPRG
jgi:hypothetical protein